MYINIRNGNEVEIAKEVIILNKKSTKENKHFVLVLILTTLSLLFCGQIYGFVFLALGTVIWSIIYIETKKKSSIEYTLSKLLILSIPLSFVSILNGSYGDLPLSWFNLFIFFLTLVTMVKSGMSHKIKLNYLSIFALFMIGIALLPLLVAVSFWDGLKQYINISMVFLALILGNLVKSKFSSKEKDELITCYIQGVYIAAVGLIIQFITINFIGIDIGYYSAFGMNRRAYAFLFSDFSFLSLYLSSGAMMVFLRGKNHYKSTFKWLFITLFILVASMLTSARTGIASFLLAFALYSFGKLFILVYRGSIKSIFLIIFNGVILLGSFYILNRVRFGDLTGDSGRININSIAFDVFKQNPLLGVGFGISSYGRNISTIPHNIIFQFLTQGGIIFTLPLVIFLFTVAITAWKRNRVLFWGYFSIIIGALFIPDIFNSRFLLGMIFLISIEGSPKKGKEVKV